MSVDLEAMTATERELAHAIWLFVISERSYLNYAETQKLAAGEASQYQAAKQRLASLARRYNDVFEGER